MSLSQYFNTEEFIASPELFVDVAVIPDFLSDIPIAARNNNVYHCSRTLLINSGRYLNQILDIRQY